MTIIIVVVVTVVVVVVVVPPVAKESKRLLFQERQQRSNNLVHNLLHAVEEGLLGSALSARQSDSNHWRREQKEEKPVEQLHAAPLSGVLPSIELGRTLPQRA